VKSNFVEPWRRFGKLEQARFALTLHKVWRVERKRVPRYRFCTQTSADLLSEWRVKSEEWRESACRAIGFARRPAQTSADF